MLYRILFIVLLMSTIVWGQYRITTPDTTIDRPGTWEVNNDIIAEYGRFIAKVIVDDVIITNPHGFVISAVTGPRVHINATGFEIAVSVSNVVLDGIVANNFAQAIVLNGSGCTVRNCQLFNNHHGVISHGADNVVSDNIVNDEDGWGYPILLSSVERNQVSDNTVSGGGTAISVYSGKNNKISRNHIEGSGDGIVLYAASDNRVDSTTGWARHFGISVMASGSGNVGVGNLIQGLFYDPRYPGFNPNIVSIPGNDIQGTETGV
ncbi:MAG: hypothetical protein UV02_C0014G0001, partial [Candidatus Kuenenbacteria bacterium GW2011_GWA2_42_15]